MSLSRNVETVRSHIAEAAKKSGREAESITLVGVTKTIEPARIKELIAAGVSDIGENKVQEFLPKYEELTEGDASACNWHFIGHLQRNKVKFIADKVCLIHSLDSLSLAEEINKRGEKLGKKINILIEVNIAEEPSKHGISPNKVFEFAEMLVKMPFLSPTGLMCVAPFVSNQEENRVHFERMRNLLVDINRKCIYYEMSELSMGMTLDYPVAIEEGATYVRVGTALFGSRS